MRAEATRHRFSVCACRCAVAVCAMLAVAGVARFASPAAAQSSWATVVAAPNTTQPAQQPAPSAAKPPPMKKPTAAAKPAAVAKSATTGSIPAAAKPVATTKPAVGPAFDTFMASTQQAAQRPGETTASAASQPVAGAPLPPLAPSPAAPAAKSLPPPAPEAPRQSPKPAASEEFSTAAARQYCLNIADAAAEAKFAWQKKVMTELAADLEMRVGLLDEKMAEVQRWVTRRDEFMKKARDNLVLIYSRMRPDAAAMQLVAMDEETAAAVLLKLDPRAAGLILNEMDPAKAARLTATINGAAKDTKEAPPATAKGRSEAGKS